MHGVPPDLDLSPFDGTRLINVIVGMSNTKFVFEVEALTYADINVESLWEIRGADGELINARPRPDGDESEPLHLHLILGEIVAASEVAAPDWFELVFGNGLRLRVHDDSRIYESFTIDPGGWVV